jgi:S1-C subfamily serine protease
MPDVDGFYSRYIDGRDSLPYEAVFAKAGLAFSRQVVTVPFVGVSSGATPSGELVVQSITPGSSAEQAGVEPGDVLVSIGDLKVTADQDWGATFRTRYRGKAGQPITLTVRRGGRDLTLNTSVRERTNSRVSLARAPNPTAKQAKLWQGIATGL